MSVEYGEEVPREIFKVIISSSHLSESRLRAYGRMHLQVQAFYFFATGILTCSYGDSMFPLLSNIL